MADVEHPIIQEAMKELAPWLADPLSPGVREIIEKILAKLYQKGHSNGMGYTLNSLKD